ncbi:MAG: class I SAM-dependent methyltransferase [Candidatus Riflebacteria bacterium]|nr:class I SAM-dependent methyltransferase [Candidatus Riflebacteria bacterium]
MSDPWKSGRYVDRYNELYGFAAADAQTFLKPLELAAGDTYVDFGCGQGVALRVAASTVARVLGVDVSPQQAARARELVGPLANVQVQECPFLLCDLSGYRFTKGSARKALHHLTDPEKRQFFGRIGASFEDGALFLIEDGIFDFDRSELEQRLPAVLAEAEGFYGERWSKMSSDFLVTMRDEFPTGFCTWETSLAEGGFTVVQRTRATSFLGTILARKG